MARSKTTGMALRIPDQVWRDPGLAFETKRVVGGRAHRSTIRSITHSRNAFRTIYFLVLLLIAICLPTVGRSVHVPERVKHASSAGLGARAPSMRDDGRLQTSIVASSRWRSLLANPSVSADFVPALHEALLSENPGPVDSLRVMARSPLGSLAAQPLRNTDLDSLSWFLGSSTRSEKRVAGDSRLARLTTYWPEEGDYQTKGGLSSTGTRLRDGHCAVDPKVIPYGSVVAIPGVGEFVAVDTGPAVVSRRAARQFGRNADERRALVVDIYCSSRSKANAFEASAPEFAVITWSR
jgi:3D (Asp-Asp-Asp) domain-containing protein